MDDRTAWVILGADPDRIFDGLSKKSPEGKVLAANRLLELAKKESKKLSFENHPDRGGDPRKFNDIIDAIKHIESSTANFVRKVRFKMVTDEAKARRKK